MTNLISGLFLVMVAVVAASALQFDPRHGTTWNIPMTWKGSGNELQIRTQGMCDDMPWQRWSWNNATGKVTLRIHAEGMPRRPTVCYDFNPSNQYNHWPYPCVNGGWQLYIVSKIYKIPVTCYYDPVTKLLLGTDYDHYGNHIPSNAIQVRCDAMSMFTTPQFSVVSGTVDETFTFDYSDMRDEYGRSGTLLSLPLTNLSDPTSFVNLYTNWYELEKPLPVIDFADILDDINTSTDPFLPGMIGAGFTYVPNPKPYYLQSRDNLMLGTFGAINLLASLPGYDVAQCAAAYQGEANVMCGTFQYDNFFPFLHGC